MCEKNDTTQLQTIDLLMITFVSFEAIYTVVQ